MRAILELFCFSFFEDLPHTVGNLLYVTHCVYFVQKKAVGLLCCTAVISIKPHQMSCTVNLRRAGLWPCKFVVYVCSNLQSKASIFHHFLKQGLCSIVLLCCFFFDNFARLSSCTFHGNPLLCCERKREKWVFHAEHFNFTFCWREKAFASRRWQGSSSVMLKNERRVDFFIFQTREFISSRRVGALDVCLYLWLRWWVGKAKRNSKN